MTKQTVKVNLYTIVSRAVEEGIEYGYNRAHKHTDTPTPEYIKTEIDLAIMNELSEVLNFGGDDAEGEVV